MKIALKTLKARRTKKVQTPADELSTSELAIRVIADALTA